jgi:hypothetical protein
MTTKKTQLEPQLEAQLEAVREIRDLMNKSSRFISLSGLSGVCAGIFALIGAAVAFWYLGLSFYEPTNYYYIESANKFIIFFCADAATVLVTSILASIYFTTRKAKRQGLPIWDKTAQRMLINLLLPLVVGGLFCLALLLHGFAILVAPATLIFYGLGLLNASKYTLHDLRYLAISEIILGLIASFLSGYGLLFWAIGFGILHIVYGWFMYHKYEN